MSVEQIVDVPENGEVTIQIPEGLKNSKRIKIVINEVDEDWEEKIALLQKAPYNKDFMADLYEVHNGFKNIEGPIE